MKTQNELIASLDKITNKNDLRSHLNGIYTNQNHLFATNGHIYVRIICHNQKIDDGYYKIEKTSLGKDIVKLESERDYSYFEKIMAKETHPLRGNPSFNLNYIALFHNVVNKIIPGKNIRTTFSMNNEMLVLTASNDDYTIEAGIMPLRNL